MDPAKYFFKEGIMFRFEGLDVWKRAAAMAVEMMVLAVELDRSHKYKIADQLRRAALSVSNNIAEGSGSSSRKDFKVSLNYSHRSVFEVANIVMLCAHCGWIPQGRVSGYTKA